MREMLEGATKDGQSLDVLTGDYLAELTMLILGKDQLKDPSLGYARTFVRQVEDCLGLALESGVKIVANAGGLNPAGLADRLREVATGLGLDPAIAHVEGDDVRHLRLGLEGALTANAYLGGFGIAAALTAGADVVVTGRVTDASLVVGPAVAHHGWSATSYDELAGAVVAGHVIECGTQATGGNFSGFLDLPRRDRPLGFPIAEVAADGSSVITKHAGTGGAVTVDTVTAQLVYEIQSTRYLGPDVTVHLDALRLEEVGEDRVAITDVVGEAPPEQLKVCVNELGGWRNTAEFVLTGLDVEAKADWVRDQLGGRLTAGEVVWSDVTAPPADAPTEESASTLLRCTVKDPSPDPVGRAFTSAVVELALGSYPGFTMTAPPAAARRSASTARPTSTAPTSPTPSSTPTAPARSSPTPASACPRARHPAPARRRTPAAPTCSPAACRSARSSTRAPATRAATPTSGSGWRTTASTPRRTTPACSGCSS